MSHTGVAIGTSPWLKSMATAETIPITRPRVSITRPAAVAAVQRGVDLEHVLEGPAHVAAHDAGVDRVELGAAAERETQGDHPAELGQLAGSIARSSGRGTRPSGIRSILITAKSSLSGDLSSWRVRTGGLATPAISTLGEPSVL